MAKSYLIVGGLLSTLIVGATLTLPCAAAAPQDSSVASTTASVAKPSLNDLKTTLARLESVGDYNAYFIQGSLALTPETPFYSEYLYLYRLASSFEPLITYYDQLPAEFLTDAITAANDAIKATNLLMRGEAILAAERAAKSQEKVQATPTSQNHQAPQNSAASSSSTSSAGKKSTQSPSQTSAKSQGTVASATTATQTTSADKQGQITETETVATTIEVRVEEPVDTKDATDDTVEVPATGAEQKSPLPIFVGIIAGAAAVSIAIAAFLRRTPSRSRKY